MCFGFIENTLERAIDLDVEGQQEPEARWPLQQASRMTSICPGR